MRQRGSAHVEAVVAAALLAAAALPIFALLATAAAQARGLAAHVIALSLARARLEELQAGAWDAVSPSPAAPDGRHPAFAVATLQVAEPEPGLKRVTVAVTWQERRPGAFTLVGQVYRR